MSRKERRQGSKKATLESIKAWHKKRKIAEWWAKHEEAIGMTFLFIGGYVILWLLFAIDMCNNY